MDENQTNNQDRPSEDRGSRNAFPRLSLRKVLPLVKKILELGEGDPVPRLVVFDKLGKAPNSGPSRMLVTTSSAYGLTTGGYQAERLGITDLGKALASSNSSMLTQEVIRVLLSNDLFNKFYDKHKGKGLPSEPIAIDSLKQLAGLNEKDAKAASEVFAENMKDYGFIKELSGKLTVVTRDMLEITPSDEVPQVKPESSTTTDATSINDTANVNPQSSSTYVGGGKQQLMPQFNFNIQIQLPEDASPEQYDAIFKSMAEHLLVLREG